MTCILVGHDGSAASARAVEHAKKLALLIGDCKLHLAFVIEWSPYSFHTPEELAERHKRREAEVGAARSHVLDPAVKQLDGSGLEVTTEVRHGDPAVLLNEMAVKLGAEQVVIGRTGDSGLKDRLFGSVSSKLISISSVPVTIIP
ncbi:universal stress protein [Amaricoccus tamworthensis]|uniref:universal stress protein n=1 Tax=Amaricoccus tamworthensis TaxID=57002 RepID=UPI003C7DD76F